MKRIFGLALSVALSCALALCGMPAGIFSALSSSDSPITQAFAASSASYSWKSSYGKSYFYDLAYPYGGGGAKIKVKGVKDVIIDVSYWNGHAIGKTINWKKVAASGVTGVIIRCGYGSNSSSQDDKDWLKNVAGAQKYGLKVGVYLYSYATAVTGKTSSAASEAKHVLRCLKEADLYPSELALPIYYDLEDSSQSGFSKSKLAKMAKKFCKKISAAGYKVGIYASTSWWNNQLSEVDCAKYGWSRWVAQYNKQCTFCTTANGAQEPVKNYKNYLDIWQFSSHGKVSGISGVVDMNFSFVTFPHSNDFQITYELNKGANHTKNPAAYDVKTTFAFFNPKRKGYSFKGWYTDEALTARIKEITEDMTGDLKLYAKWKIKTYSITYKLSKGKLAEEPLTSYKVTTKTFALPTPTRKGYTFKGWYTTSAKTGTAVTQLKKGSTGDKVFYAKWKKKSTKKK